MIIPGLKKEIDERFLMHRLKSTSLAGVAGGVLAVGIFGYQHFVNGIFRWDLFAIGLTMAIVKVGALVFYRITD